MFTDAKIAGFPHFRRCLLLPPANDRDTLACQERRRSTQTRSRKHVRNLGVLAPLAKFVSQPIGQNGQRVAPCFGYYKFRKREPKLKQVQVEMQAAINAYIAVTEEISDQVAVGGMLEKLLPIQTTINGLVDLETFEKRLVGVTKKAKLVGLEALGAKGFAKGL